MLLVDWIIGRIVKSPVVLAALLAGAFALGGAGGAGTARWFYAGTVSDLTDRVGELTAENKRARESIDTIRRDSQRRISQAKAGVAAARAAGAADARAAAGVIADLQARTFRNQPAADAVDEVVQAWRASR